MVGKGRMPGMPGFSVSSTSCAPAGRLSAGVAPNPTRPTLSGNYRVAPTVPSVFGGRDSARDASALRPCLCPRAKWCTRAPQPAELPKEAAAAAATSSSPCCILYVFVCRLADCSFHPCFISRSSGKKPDIRKSCIWRDLRARRSRY